MKNKKRSIALYISLCIIISLITLITLPLAIFASEETVYIHSADEFIEFSKKCSYDAWSVGKTFSLEADISLEGKDFEPIPSFSGKFEGNGHTVSGVNIVGAYSPAGLFSSLEKDGEIKNLNVEGVVSPDGDKGIVGGIVGINNGKIENCSFGGTVTGAKDVGGIAGINKVSGTVSACKVYGEIIGENRTGGITGTNSGLVSSCENKAKVNTISITPTLSLDEINVSLTLDITKLPTLNNSAMNDTGGISGYTTGMIIGCTNLGTVGYPHIGYNVGGISGRSRGHLANNLNEGEIFGRKDVGGIVGQIEPNISYELSEDLISALKAKLDKLGASVGGALGTGGGSIPVISSKLDIILDNIDLATDSANKILNGISDYGNGLTDEVNRFSEIIGEVISQTAEISDSLPQLSKLFGESLGKLESAFSNLESFSSVSAGALTDLANALDNASSAFGKISESLNSINGALSALENALAVNDKDAAKEAMTLIADSLGEFTKAADSFANAIKNTADTLGDTPWMTDIISTLTELSNVFGDISKSVSDIYEVISKLSQSEDIYPSDAIEHFSNAVKSVGNAAELLYEGIEKITAGFHTLSKSVTANDIDTVKKAIEDIGTGFDLMVEGANATGGALTEMSELISNIEKSEDLFYVLPELSKALAELQKSVDKIANGFSAIRNGFSAIFDNVKIDFDSISESASLILGGMGDIESSANEINKAVSYLNSAISALEKAMGSLDSEDEEKLWAALESAYAAIGDLIEATSSLSDLFKRIISSFDLIIDWGDDVASSLSKVTDAMTEMSGALVNIQSGIDALRKNVSFDTDSVKEGLALLRDGLSKMADASAYLKECFSNISDAITKVGGGSDHLNNSLADLKEFFSLLKDGADVITDISESLHSLVSYLKGIDPIQLPLPDESITAEANQLFIYISNIESALKQLNSDITSLGSDTVKQISEINAIFNELSDNIVDIIYGLNSGNIIDNKVNPEELDSITSGRLFSCINKGSVQGDINVGGIGGAMGLEYALDPEDDLSIELSVTQKKQYKLKAVVHACVNYGNVTSKRDCAGGIVGKMDIGLIYGSGAYCNVESRSGDYVGGIAGITAGLVSDCFAKCTLYGDRYIGGIVGCGVTEDYSGDSSMVKDSYSMVRIGRYIQYAGAISGINTGEYSNNIFVSDTLAGIDRVSYLGKAEPVSYGELVKRRGVDDGFFKFTVKFIVEGNTIYSIEIDYNGSVSPDLFPDIPEKEGYYSYWDKATLTDIVFDTDVNAVYKPYITAIESEETRENGRPIFFVQGEFTEGQSIVIGKEYGISDFVLNDKLFVKYDLAESFLLTLPHDKQDVNTLHFLPENGNCRIFVKINGAWQQVEAKEFGSYLVFDANGDEIEIAVIEYTLKLIPIIIASALALLIISAAVTACVISKKKKAKV